MYDGLEYFIRYSWMLIEFSHDNSCHANIKAIPLSSYTYVSANRYETEQRACMWYATFWSKNHSWDYILDYVNLITITKCTRMTRELCKRKT